MMRDQVRVFLLLILTLLMLACGGSRGEETPFVEQPQETEEPSDIESSTLSDQGASIEITNASGVDIWGIYLSPTTSEDWGEDWLTGAPIGVGETYLLEGLLEGRYDVKAEDQEGTVVEVLAGVEIEGDMTWTIEGLSSLTVVNNSGAAIGGLYFSASGSSEEGDNLLGGTTVAVGDQHVIASIPRGTYDIEAVDVDGNDIEMVYAVSLYGQRSWTVLGRVPLPDNAVLRFEEEFSDNRNNWGNSESEDVNYMAPANGEYCILIKSNQMTAWEWYDPFRTDQFVAEVSCMPDLGSDAGCGLGFGPDADNLYWFEISPSNQTFALFLLENDEWQDSLIDWSESKNIIPDEMNTLSLERVDGVVSAYINGVLVGRLESGRFPEGRVGIGGATYEQGDVQVCLDDLRVWRLE